MNEVWKDIPRYPHCEVSNNGKVRYKRDFYIHCQAKTKQERPLKLGGFGYYQVNLLPEDRSSYGNTESVHNLVAEAFIGSKPGESYRVDHINENLLDNRPENLRWITHAENVSRSSNTGKGTKHGRFAGNKNILTVRRRITNDNYN
jgi:hypothetical protein